MTRVATARPACAAVAGLLLVLALAPAAAGAASGSVSAAAELLVGKRAYRLERAVTREARRYFSAQEALKAAGLRYSWEPATGRLAFGTGGRAAIVWAGVPSVSVNRRRVPLSAPPFVLRDELMVPADFADGPLAAVVGQPVRVVFRGPVPVAPAYAFTTVVLDPGHGGRDTGAVGPGGTLEKDLTLAIARRVRERLRRASDLTVLLTRDADVFVPLEARVALANARGADLFVSIHLNSAPNPAAAGTETYFLSAVASDEAARASAERENRSLELEGRPAGTPPPDIGLILADLLRSAALRESEAFAALLEDRLAGLAPGPGGDSRGVKQAPFFVLVGARMPA
ncbi:MAG TPA: N-acetylmuramoyl-L-alanine amidase, partial [Thermodesulfobacteriota bacterium]|nr:N-acetylmuramoyl-L-alanine amidase [Thermodesulfobacteriota bacterium]